MKKKKNDKTIIIYLLILYNCKIYYIYMYIFTFIKGIMSSLQIKDNIIYIISFCFSNSVKEIFFLCLLFELLSLKFSH